MCILGAILWMSGLTAAQHNAMCAAMLTTAVFAYFLRSAPAIGLCSVSGRLTFDSPSERREVEGGLLPAPICANPKRFAVFVVAFVDQLVLPLSTGACWSVFWETEVVQSASRVALLHPPMLQLTFWLSVVVVGFLVGIGGFCALVMVESANPYAEHPVRKAVPTVVLSCFVLMMPAAISTAASVFACDPLDTAVLLYDRSMTCRSATHVTYCALAVVLMFAVLLPPYHMALMWLRNLDERSEEPRSQQPMIAPLYLEWALLCRLVRLAALPLVAAAGQRGVVLCCPILLDSLTVLLLWSTRVTNISPLRWLVAAQTAFMLALDVLTAILVTWRGDIVSESSAQGIWLGMVACSIAAPALGVVLKFGCQSERDASDAYASHAADVYDGEPQVIF